MTPRMKPCDVDGCDGRYTAGLSPAGVVHWHELQLAEAKQQEQAARRAVRKAQDRVKYHKRKIEEAKRRT